MTSIFQRIRTWGKKSFWLFQLHLSNRQQLQLLELKLSQRIDKTMFVTLKFDAIERQGYFTPFGRGNPRMPHFHEHHWAQRPLRGITPYQSLTAESSDGDRSTLDAFTELFDVDCCRPSTELVQTMLYVQAIRMHRRTECFIKKNILLPPNAVECKILQENCQTFSGNKPGPLGDKERPHLHPITAFSRAWRLQLFLFQPLI